MASDQGERVGLLTRIMAIAGQDIGPLFDDQPVAELRELLEHLEEAQRQAQELGPLALKWSLPMQREPGTDGGA